MREELHAFPGVEFLLRHELKRAGMENLRVPVRVRKRKAVKLLTDHAPGEFRLDGRVIRRGLLIEAAHPAHDRIAQVEFAGNTARHCRRRLRRSRRRG